MNKNREYINSSESQNKDRKEWIRNVANEARKRLASKTKEDGGIIHEERTGYDKPILEFDDLLDYSLIACNYMVKGYSDKHSLAKVMINEFGDEIRFLIGGIYGQATGMMRMLPKDISDLMYMFNNKFEEVTLPNS